MALFQEKNRHKREFTEISNLKILNSNIAPIFKLSNLDGTDVCQRTKKINM